MNSSPQPDTARSGGWLTWKRAFFVVLPLAVVLLAIQLWPGGSATDDSLGVEVFDPEVAPVEFHYLDNERAAAYLAQLQGGAARLERVTRTLKAATGVTASVAGAEAGASQEQERFIEREVTPTAASVFFQLFDALRDGGFLTRLRDRPPPKEGDFVQIDHVELVDPDYLSPYLVVRQAETLSAVFPLRSTDPDQRRTVERQREKAKQFAEQVGPNPRFVFFFKRHGRFLLPMRYKQLTDERSLIRDGGGDFTVIGKLVRVFNDADPALSEYKDAPTREAWAYALDKAPTDLLVQSSPECAEAHDVDGCLLRLLRQETSVPGRGGVILPIAVFK
jgi:hypothetical protein